MQFKTVLRAATAAVAIASIATPAFAQEEATPETDRTLETVVTLGTRVANRSPLTWCLRLRSRRSVSAN